MKIAVSESSKRFISRFFGPRFHQKLRKIYLAWDVPRRGRPSEVECRVVEDLIQPGDSVADLGANIGLYSFLFSQLVGPTGRVYSCEPLGENLAILESVIRKAKLSNVTLLPCAVGSRPGQQTMVIPRGGDSGGYYLAHFQEVGDSGDSRMVDVVTLDQLWESGRVPHLDFLKCDVEGAEAEALKGGRKMIEALLPGFLMEVIRRTSEEVFAFFSELGYYAFVYDGRLVRTKFYRDKEFSNYFFLHPQSKLGRRALDI